MKLNNSYSQIIKSSSVIGGAAGIAMMLGMIRTKFAALLIGTGGVGIIAGFTAIQGIVGTVAGLGIHSSAVREIAAAVVKNDEQTIGRIVLTLNRICWASGLAGMVIMIFLSPLLSRLTFDSDAYILDIAAFGIVILLANLAAGQLALLQGMRRIKDIALANIIGALFATVSSICLFYFLGVRGVTPSLIGIAAIQLVIAWYFARRIPMPSVALNWAQTIREASKMTKIGLVVMWTSLMVTGTTYFTIILITNEFSINAVGLYSAAFTLSGISVNFVLAGMGTDYYPRLVSVIHEKETVNCIVNEQTEVGLLLAFPGLLFTLVLAPWILQFFYTTEFTAATGLLQWFVLGCLCRVISFPLGHLILALGKVRLYFMTETFVNLVHLTFIAVFLNWFGIEGVAMAFFAMNVVYIAIVLLVGRRLTEFNWSVNFRRTALYILTACIITFVVCQTFPVWPATLIGMAITLTLGVFGLRELTRMVGPKHPLVRFIGTLPIVKLFFIRE
jgi:antigen flippase